VALSTAYKWMRDRKSVRERRPRRGDGQTLDAPTFVRLLSSRAVGNPIAVRVGTAEIEVRRDFDADLLRAVVEALRGGGG
jgi:hypothetical protein